MSTKYEDDDDTKFIRLGARRPLNLSDRENPYDSSSHRFIGHTNDRHLESSHEDHLPSYDEPAYENSSYGAPSTYNPYISVLQQKIMQIEGQIQSLLSEQSQLKGQLQSLSTVPGTYSSKIKNGISRGISRA